jgi:hypothetical protein
MTHEPPATLQLFVIFENEDKTECGIMPRIDWDKTVYSQTDSQGKPMTIVRAFTAMSWEDAMGVYNDHYDFEPYRPPVTEVKMGWKYTLLAIFAVLALLAWPFLTIGGWINSKVHPGQGQYDPCACRQATTPEQIERDCHAKP